MKGSFLSNPHFQDELIKFLILDRNFLKEASHLFSEHDLERINNHGGTERADLARMALGFWRRYHEPLGRKMLKVEMMEYAAKRAMDKEPRKRLFDYGESLVNGKVRLVAIDSVLEKVKQYKADLAISKAIENMQTTMEMSVLTPEDFVDTARKAVEHLGKTAGTPTSIFSNKELERRIARRALQQRRQRFPVLLIDPIDRMIRIIARKHLGLILAPYGRGKTLFFVWLALAYTLQGYNVMHFTLEDPQEDVEDRFDAAVTSLPMTRLVEVPDKVRARFQRYKKMLRTRLKVVDGTDGAITISAVEHIWEQERSRGFTADVVIVDYDDEIRPERKQTERRMEFADIYRDLRALAARHQLIVWTASQTSRKSEEMKIIGGQYIAEDISKIRKASFAMSLGKGEWGEESIFLWVAKHRYDMDHVGANICTDKGRSLFYDRDATLKKEVEERNKVKE
jgi:replicative DNA helicase